MTTIAMVRRQTGDRAYRWSSTGSHDARPNASCCRPSKPSMPASNVRRDHEPEPPPPTSRVIARAEAPASTHHRPRVRSLAASGRRPRYSWLRWAAAGDTVERRTRVLIKTPVCNPERPHRFSESSTSKTCQKYPIDMQPNSGLNELR